MHSDYTWPNRATRLHSLLWHFSTPARCPEKKHTQQTTLGVRAHVRQTERPSASWLSTAPPSSVSVCVCVCVCFGWLCPGFMAGLCPVGLFVRKERTNRTRIIICPNVDGECICLGCIAVLGACRRTHTHTPHKILKKKARPSYECRCILCTCVCVCECACSR